MTLQGLLKPKSNSAACPMEGPQASRCTQQQAARHAWQRRSRRRLRNDAPAPWCCCSTFMATETLSAAEILIQQQQRGVRAWWEADKKWRNDTLHSFGAIASCTTGLLITAAALVLYLHQPPYFDAQNARRSPSIMSTASLVHTSTRCIVVFPVR